MIRAFASAFMWTHASIQTTHNCVNKTTLVIPPSAWFCFPVMTYVGLTHLPIWIIFTSSHTMAQKSKQCVTQTAENDTRRSTQSVFQGTWICNTFIFASELSKPNIFCHKSLKRFCSSRPTVFAVLHSHSSNINYTEKWTWEVCNKCVMLLCQYGQKSLKIVFLMFLNL